MTKTYSTWVELLSARAADCPDKTAFTFSSTNRHDVTVTHAQLDRRARAVAALITETLDGKPRGERVLLLFQPGLDYLAAFFGCLYAGVVAVPAYPPNPNRMHRSVPRLRSITNDAEIRMVLGNRAVTSFEQAMGGEGEIFENLIWCAIEDAEAGMADLWREPELSGDSLAFLQYTSGSTATPKGVLVSHGNLMANQAAAQRGFGTDDRSNTVSWLPLYHDMGLIGAILHPLYLGASCTFLSPMDFLRRPVRWLKIISEQRAVLSGGPDFAYALCARKVSEEDRAGLDLSCWDIAFNGAEPIRPETLDAFCKVFSSCGFRREAFHPCYGLAEVTLFVCSVARGTPPVRSTVDTDKLAAGKLQPTDKGRVLVSSGRPDMDVRIVDPETFVQKPDGDVGEIWIAGPSVTGGYFRRKEATRETFDARLHSGEGPFLRTGDLGALLNGELYVTGRCKDLIIIRGRNLYPQDIEQTVEAHNPNLPPGRGAAISIPGDDGEQLVVIWEISRHSKLDPDEVIDTIREAVFEEHEARVYTVALIKTGTIPKTSSGKIQRAACRAMFLEDRLELVKRSHNDDPAPKPVQPESAIRAELTTASDDRTRRRLLISWLRRTVAGILGRDPAHMLEDRSLASLGLDSLAAVEVQHQVESQLSLVLPIDNFFDGGSLRSIARTLLYRLAEPVEEEVPIERQGNPLGHHPLSHGQQALWFHTHLRPESAAYNISRAMTLLGDVDIPALRGAFESLVARHPMLRTTLEMVKGESFQQVHRTLVPRLQEVDATSWSEDQLHTYLVTEAHRPFGTGHLLRLHLIRRPDNEYVLQLTVHHACVDFWSLSLIMHEIGVSYRALREKRPVPLGKPALRYTDYIHWQRRLLAGTRGEQLWEFWENLLPADPPVLDIPTDFPRPTELSERGAFYNFYLPARLIRRIKRLARSQETTLHTVLLSAFCVLLHRYGGQDELVVGSPSMGRTRAGLADVVGYFVNPLPLPVTFRHAGETLSFDQILERMKRTAMAALAHGDFPFPLMVERLQPRRDPAFSPVFQAMFVYQSTPPYGQEGIGAFAMGEDEVYLNLDGLEMESFSFEHQATPFDLTLVTGETGSDRLRFTLEYNMDLFTRSSMERMAARYGLLLEGIAAHIDRSVDQLPFLSHTERNHLLVNYNQTRNTFDRELLLHQGFQEQAEINGDGTALVFGDRNITYSELNSRADRLTGHLLTLGVRPETRVALLMERRVEMIVSMLAVLKAGGAYVPLDPAYPQDRREHMIQDAAAPILLTTRNVPHADTVATVVNVEDLRDLPTPKAETPNVVTHSCQLAYLIYTSGSTGKPKAVSVTHRNAVALVSWAQSVYSPKDLRGVLAATSICFDLSIFEIFLPLSVGGTVFLVENVLACANIPRTGEVTLINTVPSAAAELVHGSWLPPRVRVINLAGEPLSRALVDDLYKHSSAQRIYDLYGPSEDTTYSTCALRTPGGPVVIGRPIHNTEVYLLDKHLNPVPLGLPGELYLAGEGLSRGYLNHPELTAAAFVPNPLSNEPGKRLYRTGDLARYLPRAGSNASGLDRDMPSLVFLGRADRQVKVRGFRVEPGEIETRLFKHEAVARCVVVTDGRRQAANLLAYVVFEPECHVTPLELAEYLKQTLPDYMIPALFITMDSLPVLPNGKLDHSALPAPETYRCASYVAPRDVREATLRDIWAQVLNLPRIGVDDNFFELGGHSLSATRVISRVRETFGVELPLRLIFETPTVAALAAHLFNADEHTLPPLRPTSEFNEPGIPLPLSFSQQRLWFLDRLEGAGPTYNVPVALCLDGPLDTGALEAAFDHMAERHDSLRTIFIDQDGEPFQVVCAHHSYLLPIIDISTLPPTRIEEELVKLIRNHGRKVFNLATGPLISVRLVRVERETHYLLVNQHHIITDGWSLGVMVEELKTLYAAAVTDEPVTLPPLPVQYADFTLWQRSWLHGDLLEQQVAWWREELDGAPDVLPLPIDRQRPIMQTFEGARINVTLDLDTTQRLNRLAQEHGVTLFMVLLAAYADFLSRYSHKDDLTIGFPIANRNRAELENLLGFFINTLVIRVDLRARDNAAISLEELLHRVREAALGAWAHQNVPFEKLVDELNPERDTSHSPLFQVMFALQNTPMEAFNLPGLEVSLADRSTDIAKFDLSLDLRETNTGLEGFLEYNTTLFEDSTARRMHRHLLNLIRAYAALADNDGPRVLLPNISLLDHGERQRLLYAWNDTVEGYPHADTVHGLFQARAITIPGATAAIFDHGTLSFGELDARSNQMARHLRELGVTRETLVGVLLGRSPEMLITLFGILKAGGAYMPLDTGYPAERLVYMVQDAEVRVLVTDTNAPDPGFGEVRRLYMDKERAVIGAHSREPLNLKVFADNPIHIHYTSGSTGKPKGVLGTHRGVINRLNWMWRVYPFEVEDLCIQKTALSFVDAVWEIFGPALAGQTTVYAADEVTRDPVRLMLRLEETGVTRLVLVPSLLESFMAADSDWARRLHKIKFWVTSGEALPPDLCYRFYKDNPDALLLNLYGSSEVSADVTAFETRIGLSPERVPIGHAVDNTRIYITGPRGQLCPTGVPGELQAGGAGLGRGYLGQPALTAEKFVPDPYSNIPGERLYRTGDLARRLGDGTLSFCGRIDHQVKVRGFRIELGEIESVLSAFPGVANAVVLAADDKNGGHRLSAFAVLDENEKHITASLLRGALSRSLPDYMVPATITILHDMPLTPNGKLDRQALINLAEEALPISNSVFAAPRNPTENLLCGIWVEVLMLDRPIGVHDNFFELGGHSLTATRVVSRVRKQMGADLSLQDFFRAPTVAALSRIVGAPVVESEGIPLLSREETPGGVVHFPLSYAQQRLWFLHRLEPDSPRYNIPVVLRISGLFHPDLAYRALSQIAARHETLRTTFVTGDGDRPLQRIAPNPAVNLSVIDLMHLANPAGEADRRIHDEVAGPFDLAESPPWRAMILQMGNQEWILVFNMHHIISDGWSLSVLTREFSAAYAALYTGTRADLRPMSVQYADYAHWQRVRIQEDPDASLGWWRARLADAPTGVDLKPDMVHGGNNRPFGEVISVFKPDLTRRLKSLGRSRDATLYMTLLAAFKLLLMRYTGQADLVVGSPLANRNHSDIEHLIGFFVNTVVLRTDMRHVGHFGDLLQKVRDNTLGAYAHQELPFNYLVEVLAPERESTGNPLFNIMFALQNIPEARLTIAGVTMKQVETPDLETRFDLSPTFYENPDGSLILRFQYDAGRFTELTARRLSHLYSRLLAEVTADANLPLTAYTLGAEEERVAALERLNHGTDAYPAGDTIVSLFHKSARIHPERTALVIDNVALDYRELELRAQQLAAALMVHGLRTEEVVAVTVPRSVEMIIALLGIMKAGGSYLGLDPHAPADRNAAILETAGVRFVLYHPDWSGKLPEDRSLCLLDPTAMSRQPERPALLPLVLPESRAYISFTSGSTGKPKGVEITHRGVLRLVCQAAYLGIAGGETMLHSASLAFDASTLEIWACLLNGGRLVLLPPGDDAYGRIGETIARKGVTWVHLTAALFRLAAEEQRHLLGNLRHLATGGDAASSQHFSSVMQDCPQLSLYNCYGPTETTVLATSHQAKPGPWRTIPIGRPVNNTTVYLLDTALNPVAAGLPGQVFVGGPGLARGYLRDPSQTAARFLPNPYDPKPGQRLYRTGDLARLLPNDTLEFLGRMDHQVKIRGFRIEPAEIQAALTDHEAVSEAVVLPWTTTSGERRLVAYLQRDTDYNVDAESAHGQHEQIENWRGFFDRDIYGEDTGEDPTTNLSGWISVYDDKPIPKEEMLRWLNDAVSRLPALKPKRVLELGCGTGMFLYRLAPQAESYTGLDIAESALDHIRNHLNRPELDGTKIRLHCRAAHQIDDLPADFDLVLLNSVVQYFPRKAYLDRLLERVLEHMPSRGNIFLGDIRHFGLLPHLKADVVFFKARESENADVLRRQFGEAMEQESELLLHPDYFHALPVVEPRVRHVDVFLKQGPDHNELTCFRYDVMLHKGAVKPLPVTPRDWQETDLNRLKTILTEERPEHLAVNGIPNARVIRAACLLDLLEDEAWKGTRGAGWVQAEQALTNSIDPFAILTLARETGYTAQLMLPPGAAVTTFAVVFHRDKTPLPVQWPPEIPVASEPTANRPMKGAIERELVARLHDYLSGLLPDYMVPDHLTFLESFPRTAGGKIDRSRLPDPRLLSGIAGTGHVPPVTETETFLSGVWCELLEARRVGREDDFFDLGGHSLLATRVVSRIRAEYGVEPQLRDLFNHTRLSDMAALIDSLTDKEPQASTDTEPAAMERPEGPLPLSFAQQRLWFLDRLDGPSPTYNMPAAYRLSGELHPNALEEALNRVIQRHEILRTSFHDNRGEPCQVIHEHKPFHLSVTDLTGLPPDAMETNLEREMKMWSQITFRLDRLPLLAARLLRLGGGENLLLVNMHHIVSDGWSMSVLMSELKLFYDAATRNARIVASPLPLQYADYTLWQIERLKGGLMSTQAAWWREQMAGAPELLEIPTDHPRPAIQQFEGGRVKLRLDQNVTDGLRALARTGNATLFAVLSTAFADVLSRYSGREEICLGTPVAGRGHEGLEQLIGFFVNTLVLRMNLGLDETGMEPTVSRLVARMQETVLGAMTHRDIPFEKLVDELNPERDLSRPPLFQAMIALQNAPAGEFQLEGVTVNELDLEAGSARFDLFLNLVERDAGLSGTLEYSTTLFEHATAQTLIDRFSNLVAGYAQSVGRGAPSPRRSQVCMLDPEEHNHLLFGLNHNALPFDREVSVHSLIFDQAERRPHAVAVVAGRHRLTYGRLTRSAQDLAGRLRQQGIGPEDRVGIFVERTHHMVTAVLGVLAAGAAYVPLDPAYPAERLALLMQDAECRAMVCTRNTAAANNTDLPIVYVDQPRLSAPVKLPRTLPQQTAYLIYTSGSTGKPKGVAITHRNVISLLTWAQTLYPDELLSGVAATTSLNFDLSAFELYLPLSRGGTVYILENALALTDTPPGGEITLLNSVPSAVAELLPARLIPDSVKVVNMAGEPLSTELVDAVYTQTSAEKVYDLYGPSESTTYATVALREPGGSATIGRPIANTRAYVLDAYLSPVPVGISGELFLAGDGLARCYHGRPAQTAERFMPNPFASVHGDRLYRTGDRVKLDGRGNLIFLGRADYQIKLRGFRIEPGEIESALGDWPEIDSCAVIADLERGQLIAFTVPTEEAALPSVADMKDRLSRILPAYMIPHAFVPLNSMPRTLNGKLDRKALIASARSHGAETEHGFHPPRNQKEEKLCTIWAGVLETGKPIGIHDNFFELGGHSLSATRVVSRMRAQMKVELPLKTFFRAPTIAALVAYLDKEHDIDPILIAPRLPGSDGTLCMPLSYAQERLWFLYRASPESSWYNMPTCLQVNGPFRPDLAAAAFDTMVERHETLRTTFRVADDDSCQVIAPGGVPHIKTVDLSALSQAESAARDLSRNEAAAPFDLETGPLWRVLMLRLEPDAWMLVFTMHHIISDGWSMSVLTREFTEIYAALLTGETPDLQPMSIQYADFAVWQREQPEERMEAQSAYWRKRLAGAPSMVDLKPDFIATGSGRPRGEVVLHFDPETTERLTAMGRLHEATLYMVLLAGFKLLLQRMTGSEDLVIGSPVANRNRADIEHLIGFFVNTIVIRTRVSRTEPFKALLQAVREAAMEAYDNQDLPFNRLVEECAPERSVQATPLFNIMFSLQNMPTVGLHLRDVTIDPLPLIDQDTKFDLCPTFYPTDRGGLRFVLEYDAGRFAHRTIQRMAELYRNLLCRLPDHDALPIHAHRFMSERETMAMVLCANRTTAPYPEDRTIPDLFDEIAAAHAKQTALITGNRRVTYRTLNRQADQLAQYLISSGLRREEVVAVCLPRGVELITAMLGILKAGGAYFCPDPKAPISRLAYMLQKSGAGMVLTNRNWPGLLPPVGGLHVIDPADIPRTVKKTGIVSRSSGDRAYVSYTSGSTGVPKGVCITHRGVLRLVCRADYLNLEPGETMLLSASAAFDASTLEIWGSLLNRGRLVILDEGEEALRHIGRTIRQHEVTWAHLTAALFRLIAEEQLSDLESLKVLATGGDTASPQLCRRVLQAYPDLKLHNCYGPTETTVLATSYHALPEPRLPARIPIGKPVNNTTVYLLDHEGRAAASGMPGEIYVGGPGLARGYLGEPAQTAERFIPNTFAWSPGDRLYRTGDLARFRPDGNLEFLGRVDHQVKIRGFRIEPGEIESALTLHEAVREAVVIPREVENDERRLAAYVLTDPLHTMDSGLDRGEIMRIDNWRDFFDRDLYRRSDEEDDPTANISGWISVYDDSDIPREDMMEWLDDTVAKIRVLKPLRILEPGCGTGMFLFRLAPYAERYVGLDIAANALNHINAHLDHPTIKDRDVRLMQRAAHELDDLPADFDLVLMNSVVQYFPGLAYTDETMASARTHLAPGGAFFVGDVRHFGLLAHLKADVVVFKADDATEAAGLRRNLREALDQESELLLHPDFFYGLVARGRFSHGEVLLKQGRTHNELTAFRYDVRLHTASVDAVALEPRHWVEEQLDADKLTDLLTQPGRDLLAVHAIPNARTARASKLLALLEDPGWNGTRKQAWDQAEACITRHVDPQDLVDLGRKAGYGVRLMHAPGAAPHTFAAVFSKDPTVPVRWPGLSSTADIQRAHLANRPMKGVRKIELAARLRDYLAGVLPDYLIPEHLEIMDQFPRTAGGKVDRGRLPDPRGLIGVSGYVPPKTVTETDLAEIWAELLERRHVGRHADFFQLGGHSLMAVRLLNRIQSRFHVRLPVSVVFQQPTLAGLADLIDTASLETRCLTRLNSETDGRPWFMIHPAGGQTHWYLPLAGNLDVPVFGLESPALKGGDLFTDLSELAAFYLESALDTGAQEPFRLLGWSLGGPIAFEMALQLEERGKTPACLVLVDSLRRQQIGNWNETTRALVFLHDLMSDVSEAQRQKALAAASPGDSAATLFRKLKERNLLPEEWAPEFLRDMFRVYEANLGMAADYQPGRAYRGQVILVRAQDSVSSGQISDLCNGWGNFCKGDLRVVDMPGDHYNLLRRERVGRLVRLLKRAMAVEAVP
ncbi:MAG: non-ribosomal peptide synthase/polyketide synthase [Acidobacteriota bacterium]|nr:non-ribosomal peptide synthase/polyketide synthase [Acidobacteriota bacterium]